MIHTHIHEQFQYITGLICKKRLKEAIVELKGFLVDAHEWELQQRLEQVEVAYNFMLDYMKQGAKDPTRSQMFHKLIRDTLSIADQALLARLSLLPGISFFNTRNELHHRQTTFSMDDIILELETYTENYAVSNLTQGPSAERINEIRNRHEQMQTYLFSKAWTETVWTEDELQAANKLLASVLVPVNDMCLFISAITLSLMTCFDIRKIQLLFDAYAHASNMVNQRALVALAIIFQLYHERLPFYTEIALRLDALNEDEKFSQDLGRVQIQMLRAKETEKIDKKMREEIIPEMIKSAQEKNFTINPDEHDEESEDFNPDWAQDFENSPLADKLKEMSELQMEGADVYMTTFSQLKTYPFFKQIGNWFYPFDNQHSTVVKELEGGAGSTIFDLILKSPFFCDSDKYSLCFTIMHIPKSQRDMMVSQISEQQLNEMMDDEKLQSVKQAAEKPEIITNQYLHDLYRFFKLYPRRHEFKDIFNESLKLNEYPVLNKCMGKPELLRNLGDYYFRKGYFSEASEVYLSLIAINAYNEESYQRLGYCYQKQKDYPKAIDAYLKADMIKPDVVWTNRHLATCFRVLKEYEKAVTYYKRVETVQPENRTLLFNTGSCLVELERFDEALQYFFKLDFIEPDNLRTWRAIAWCSFVLKKYEQAQRYYGKIIQSAPEFLDFLNAGHTAWCLGDLEKAADCYAKAYHLAESRTRFFDAFEKDKVFLLKSGINDDDIALMCDSL